MAKVIVTTRRCPCCKYEYQQEDIYKDEDKPKKRYKSKSTGEIIDIDERHFEHSWRFELKISREYDVITEMVPEEVFDNSKVTKGDKDFKSLVTVLTGLSEDGDFDGYSKSLGMFCPNCGVFLDTNICTTVSEKKL